ncbi:MAG: TIGR01458 family HAD-type hydrolase [Acidobacteriota bacterium]|nr:TIGR01458 family HAD-type hydrolase [Acidobacteriota bacterium]
MGFDAHPPADGLLIDLDGTLWEDGKLIAGAGEAIDALRTAGIPFRFLTNTTRKPRSTLVAELAGLGIETSTYECFTAPAAAAIWLGRRGVGRVSLLIAEASFEDFSGFELDDETPEAVVIGDLGRGWTFDALDRAFRAVIAGADLIALQKNRYWKTAGRLSLDAGPFVAALEYATGKQATLVGKPSRELFHTMAAELDLPPERVAMVGDDIEADVEGARAANLQAVAVRTGKYRPADEKWAREAATTVIDSLAGLPAWLRLG